jgi:hypothetical protein
MKAERLFRVLGLVDSELVEEAMPGRAPAARPPLPWRRWAALAACLALVFALGLGWQMTGGFGGYGAGMSGSASGGDSGPADPGASGAGGAGIEDGAVFMSYAGPVFPLTTIEDPAGLTAERTITWDFAPGVNSHGETRQWGAQVTDAYTLSNSTGADVTVTALYPFAGSFSDLAALRPTVTVDGEAVETRLYAGAYSGGFQSTFGADAPDTMNLDSLDSWTEYRALLESGDYLARALEPYPVLDVPVTVYEFTDFEAPHEQYRAATQAVSFSVDEAATRIFTYGFNGGDWDRDFRRYSYFVPDGIRGEPNIKLLVILGEDIGDYSLEGFQNGGCNPGEEIDGVSCTVIRSETTLDAVLDRLCRAYVEQYEQGRAVDQENAFDAVSFNMYRGAVSELMTQYGILSDTPMDRYNEGRLDDMLSEVLPQNRVLYLAFPVTAPAGGSVTVECEAWKEPSFDFACSGSEHAELQGYDLVTCLGSTLEFTRQSAALVHTEGVHITGQDFGFDPENGILSVELDPGREHYYLELRPLNEP